MALKKGFWKLALGIAGWVSIIGCLAATTFSWFTVSNSVTPSGTASTKAVSTTAKVYQNNAHDNDDPYSKEPTSDSGGTLSYDHSKGGRAVDFFIEMGSKTLQMFENVNNSGDQAAYFNIKFSSAWQIKSASGTVYGYSQLLSGCPSYGDFSNSAGKVSAGSGFYDIYLNSDTPTAHIWITPHYEVTVSDEMGEHTGYYIIGDSDDPNSSFYGCDNQVDEEHAKAMYVNAAKNTSDKAFITGLRLAPNDTISVISGDTLAKYETPEPEKDPLNPTNLLNISSYFTDDSHGVFTCHNLGYYSVALNENSRLYVSEWDGYEVDGTTSYVARDGSDNVLNAHPTGGSGIGKPTKKEAPSYSNNKLNFVKLEITGDPANAHWYIHLWGGSSGTTWPGLYMGGGSSSFVSDRIDASDYVGWTNYIISRWSAKSNGNEWGRYEGSCTANTVNFWKTNGNDGVAAPSTERFAVIAKYKVKNGSPDAEPYNTDDEVWNGAQYAVPGLPSEPGYNSKAWYKNSSLTTAYTKQAISYDTALYAKMLSGYTISFKS